MSNYIDFRPQKYGWYIADLRTGDRIEITNEWVEDRPTWSPDSTQVALTIWKPEAATGTSTYIKDLETGTLVGIQDIEQYNYQGAHDPVWSPDGNNIAYIGDYYDTKGKRHPRTLFIHDVRSGKQTLLMDEVQWSKEIIWSPDSQKIIYQSYQDQNYYVIDINTKETTELLDNEVGHVIAWE